MLRQLRLILCLCLHSSPCRRKAYTLQLDHHQFSVVRLIFENLKWINESGTTILLVEQNVARALALSHRAYVLENGRIVLDGPREALQQSPHVKQAYLGL